MCSIGMTVRNDHYLHRIRSGRRYKSLLIVNAISAAGALMKTILTAPESPPPMLAHKSHSVADHDSIRLVNLMLVPCNASPRALLHQATITLPGGHGDLGPHHPVQVVVSMYDRDSSIRTLDAGAVSTRVQPRYHGTSKTDALVALVLRSLRHLYR